MRDMLIVLCTCPNRDEAMTLGRDIVERQLAACVNILPGIESIYRWQGRVEEAAEVLLLAKTTPENFHPLRLFIEHAHSYDVPEIIACSVAEGSAAYLDWMYESVRTGPKESENFL